MQRNSSINIRKTPSPQKETPKEKDTNEYCALTIHQAHHNSISTSSSWKGRRTKKKNFILNLIICLCLSLFIPFILLFEFTALVAKVYKLFCKYTLPLICQFS